MKHLKTLTAMALVAISSSSAFAQLRVSAWGGFFEETLAAEIYPGFTEATGIEVESIAQPEDSAWMTTIANAARANQAPTDLALVTDSVVIRGNDMGLWAKMDSGAMPNMSNLIDGVVFSDDDGVSAVGALGFFVTFVTNTDYKAAAPASWADLWDGSWDGKLAINVVPQSGLMEITAETFFGGVAHMETEAGIMDVINKIGELKDETILWYRDEGQFQQGIEGGEYTAGMYYHDVAMLSIWDGLPIASTFPAEGGFGTEGYWVVPAKSKMTKEAEMFINYMSQPEVQEKMALTMGVFPLVPRASMNLSDDDFAAVGSDIPAIRPATAIYLANQEFIDREYAAMIAK